MVKGYRHDLKWKTCPEVHLWHSRLRLLNHFTFDKMKHAAEPAVPEPTAFEAEMAFENLRRYKSAGILHISTG
jgi:hypothetical protein